jgi:hypothetical protein
VGTADADGASSPPHRPFGLPWWGRALGYALALVTATVLGAQAGSAYFDDTYCMDEAVDRTSASYEQVAVPSSQSQ